MDKCEVFTIIYMPPEGEIKCRDERVKLHSYFITPPPGDAKELAARLRPLIGDLVWCVTGKK
ncbi:MAG: hypothetical protein F7C35_04760 [Desulfurococcales archaeon]|nr:hypothetical protein [Desulfurococcales archaeon]